MPTPRSTGAALALAAGAALVLVSGCGAEDGEGGSGPTVVRIDTFSFEPDPIEVRAGTAIEFRNEDAIDHTVTAGTRAAPRPDRFDGSLPEQGSTFSLILDEPGSYPYFCRIHPGPGMTATIVVTDA